MSALFRSSDAVLGSALAIGLWLVILVLVVRLRRRPFLALALLVAGMAAHNLALMVLIEARTPPALIRAIQAWKEVLLALLALVAIRFAIRRVRRGGWPRLHWTDWIMLVYTTLVVGFFAVQLLLSLGDATLMQRFISLRLSLLLPLLYALGRVVLPRRERDVWVTTGTIVTSVAAVAVFGLWELWLVPTERWTDWGAVGFSRWLGYDYGGPQGLPANFFQSLGPGVALRRMVSSYISPLGIAYTGLLVAPLAAALVIATGRHDAARRWGWLAWGLFALTVTAISLSVTRLAILCLIVEFALLVILYRNRLAAVMAGLVLVAGVFALTVYPTVGPLLASDLTEYPSLTRDWREPPSASPGPSDEPTPTPSPDPKSVASDGLIDRALRAEDPSIQAHIRAITHGIEYILRHPIGGGPGSAVPRYGDKMTGPSESALLRTGGELGIVGALLYLGMYLAGIWAGWQAWRRGTPAAARSLALVALVGGIGLGPIMLTSDVWGNFSVTFLFWWSVGLSVTLAAGDARGERPSQALPHGSGPAA